MRQPAAGNFNTDASLTLLQSILSTTNILFNKNFFGCFVEEPLLVKPELALKFFWGLGTSVNDRHFPRSFVLGPRQSFGVFVEDESRAASLNRSSNTTNWISVQQTMGCGEKQNFEQQVQK